jgi:hypothetical protein
LLVAVVAEMTWEAVVVLVVFSTEQLLSVLQVLM